MSEKEKAEMTPREAAARVALGTLVRRLNRRVERDEGAKGLVAEYLSIGEALILLDAEAFFAAQRAREETRVKIMAGFCSREGCSDEVADDRFCERHQAEADAESAAEARGEGGEVGDDIPW